MGGDVDAAGATVWRALTLRDEVVRWRPGIVGIGSPDASFPTEGRRFHWRCQVRDIPIDLVETPGEIKPIRRLESDVRLGLFRFRQVFTLVPSEAGTRVTLQIEAPNRMPLVGGSLDRFDVRRFLVELGGTYLQALRDWCEREVAAPTSPHPTSHAPSHARGPALPIPG